MAFTEQEESALRAIIGIYKAKAPSLSSDVAILSPGLFEEWDGNGHQYTAGEKFSRNGVLYVCLQSHTSQPDWAPEAAPSLWAKAVDYTEDANDPSGAPEWEPPSNEVTYPKGAVVRHNGKVWESLVDNNVWEPGASGTETVWREVAEG